MKKYHGKAIGKGSNEAISAIETLDLTKTVQQLLPEVGKILNTVHEETFSDKECIFEVLYVTKEGVKKFSVEESLRFGEQITDQMDIE